jgi:excisionase family DNA binding protein
MTGRLLTARAVADELGLHPETVLLWVRQGKLPAFKLPSGAIRVRDTDLDAWLAERATPARPVSPNTADAARTLRLSSVPSPNTDSEDQCQDR